MVGKVRFAHPTSLDARSARRHDVGVDPAARDRGFADAVAVIAGDHDRIALGVDAGDDADMAAAAAGVITAIAPTCGPETRWPYFANELAMSEPVPR